MRHIVRAVWQLKGRKGRQLSPGKRRGARRLERIESRWMLTGPSVIETDPDLQALDVPLESDIAVVFNQAVAALSVTPEAIVADSQFTGRLKIEPADIAINGDSATIALPRRLYPGERVIVTVTSNVQNVVGESAVPFQWEFRAQAIGGTADFERILPKWEITFSSGMAAGDFDRDGRIDVLAGGDGKVLLNRGQDGFEVRILGTPLPSPSSKIFDLDGDGDLDIAMFGGDDQQLWLNNGDATFSPSSTQSWPNDVTGGEFQDFNRDGAIDALFELANGGAVIALNDGAGNFAVVSAFGTGRYGGGGARAADLDGDGDLDVIGNYLQDSQLEIWTNDGDGHFAFDRTIEVRESIAYPADVDADGDLDLLASYFLFRNLGGGEFAEPVSVVEFNGAGGQVIVTDDFDGDGDLDALFNEYGESRILLNDGDGDFAETGRKIEGYESILSAGDFDQDGDLDFLSYRGLLLNKSNVLALHADFNGPHMIENGEQATYQLQVENRGAHTLSGARVEFTPPQQLRNVSWTAVASPGSSTALAGTGAIRIPVQLAPGGVIRYTISGVLEASAGLQVTFQATVTPPSNALPGFDSANLRDSSRWSSSVVAFPIAGSGYYQLSDVRLFDELSQEVNGDAQFGDLDGDGDEDAVLAPAGRNGELWFNDGAGNFTRGAQSIGVNTGGKLFLRDVHGDGDLDIYMTQIVGVHPTTRLWVNDGHGSFNRNDVAMSFVPEEIADINMDGLLDVLRHDETSGGFGWALGVRPTQFIASGQLLPSESRLAGDVDGDGDLDMFVTRVSSYRPDDGTAIWFNNGQGFFAQGQSRFLVSSFTGSQIGDVDGDGDLDMYFASARCYSCAPTEFILYDQIWLNDGAGSFTRDERLLPVRRSASVTLVDVDGDRDLDAFVQRDEQSRRFEVWWNDGTGGFASAGQFVPQLAGLTRRFADVDADGDLDALILGTNQIWLNQTEFARVRVSNDDGVSSVSVGDAVTYEVVVANDGNIASTNLRVEQSLPNWLVDVTWNAVVSGGASAALSGSGPVSEFIDLPAGASVSYTITATVARPQVSPFPDHLNATVWLTPDAGIFHPDISGLSAGESDALTIPYEGGGYLAHAKTDSLHYRLDVAAVGDLDGDGDADLVGGYDGLKVWLNNGDGEFGEPLEQFFGSAYPTSVTLVDLDKDGDLDILPTRYDTIHGSLTPLQNDGHGHFTTVFRDIGVARDVAAGDFDGDGDVDLAFARVNRGIEVYLQQTPWDFTMVDAPLDYVDVSALVAGDWDADGDPDLVAVQNGVPIVLSNDGAGRFSEVARLLSDAVHEVVAGDLNGDAHLDLFISRQGADEAWLNNGSGDFVKTSQTLGTANNLAAALADLDGDGDLDVFALSEVWFNDGAGQFVAAGFPLPKPGAGFAVTGDFDLDGDADVLSGFEIWRNFEDANDIEVTVTNQVDQLIFGQVATYSLTITNYGAHLLEGVSVLSDPFALLVDATWTSAGTSGAISAPSGVGAIDDHVTLPGGGSVTYTLTGRVDGFVGQPFALGLRSASPVGGRYFDPLENNRAIDVDLVVAAPITAGPGRFVDSGERFGVNTSEIFGADFDGDGDVDVFDASLSAPARVWMNAGNGTFDDSGQEIGEGGVRDAVFADLDHDLDLDLLLVIADAPDELWFNDGDGRFTRGDQSLGDAESTGVAAAAADLNSDGNVDLVVVADGDTLARIWWGDGAGRFPESDAIASSEGKSDVAVLDFDNDGHSDLLLSRSQSFGISIIRNDGTGRFNMTFAWGNAKPTNSVAVGDIDGDDLVDFVAAGPDGVALYLNSPTGIRPEQFLQVANVQSVGLGDVNGDGRLDLVIGRGAANGSVRSLVYRQTAASVFDSSNPQALAAAYTNVLALGDFDGDGDVDVVFGNDAARGGAATSLWLNAVQFGDTAPYDGRIDLNDLNNVRNHFGETNTDGTAGDADGDGDVDLADLNAVRNYFGESLPAPISDWPYPIDLAGAGNTQKRESRAADAVFGQVAELDQPLLDAVSGRRLASQFFAIHKPFSKKYGLR